MINSKRYIFKDFKTGEIFKIVTTHKSNATDYIMKITENWEFVNVEDIKS